MFGEMILSIITFFTQILELWYLSSGYCFNLVNILFVTYLYVYFA